MADDEHASSKISARALVAFTDAELDEYLEEHCRRGTVTVIDVEDPENLPGAFIQRLRDRAQYANSVDQSTPINLDEVTSRLLDIPPGNNTALPPRSPSHSRESSLETLPPIPREICETEHYNELVNDGGRALYPIGLIDEVAKDPLAHWDMLRPWLHYPPDYVPVASKSGDLDWRVFKRQLSDWQEFRCWQAYSRGQKPPFSVDPNALQAYCTFVRHFRRASLTYTEAIKKLLAEYDFFRQFQLDEDQGRQGELATWIEYLGYQYAIHYRYKRMIARMQPGYDRSWKTLVDAGVLRPFETEEYISDIRSAMGRHSEQIRAEEAVNSAKSSASTLLKSRHRDITDPRGPRSSSKARMPKMAAARSRLATAKSSLQLVKRRNSFVSEFAIATGFYRMTKQDIARHDMRCRWVLEQISLIKAELIESGAVHIQTDNVGRRKRRRRDEDSMENKARHDRDMKKPIQDAGVSDSSQTLTSCSHKARLNRSHDGTLVDHRPSKQSTLVGQSSRSHRGTPNGADVPISGFMQETRRVDSGGRAVAKSIGVRQTSSARKPDDRLLRNRRTGRGAPLSAINPPRRSARIAAQVRMSYLTPSRALITTGL